MVRELLSLSSSAASARRLRARPIVCLTRLAGSVVRYPKGQTSVFFSVDKATEASKEMAAVRPPDQCIAMIAYSARCAWSVCVNRALFRTSRRWQGNDSRTRSRRQQAALQLQRRAEQAPGRRGEQRAPSSKAPRRDNEQAELGIVGCTRPAGELVSGEGGGRVASARVLEGSAAPGRGPAGTAGGSQAGRARCGEQQQQQHGMDLPAAARQPGSSLSSWKSW